MRLFLVAPLVVLAACALETKVHTADPETLAGRAFSIAVLDIHEASGTWEPAVLQMHLTQALRDAEFGASTEAVRTRTSPWTEKDAARFARSRGKTAAMTVTIVARKGKIVATVRLIQAEDAKVLFEAEVAGTSDTTETEMAEALVAPLEDY